MFKRKPETPKDKIPTWFKKWNQEVFVPIINSLMKEIKSIKADIAKIKLKQAKDHDLLLKVIKLNNLKTI